MLIWPTVRVAKLISHFHRVRVRVRSGSRHIIACNFRLYDFTSRIAASFTDVLFSIAGRALEQSHWRGSFEYVLMQKQISEGS